MAILLDSSKYYFLQGINASEICLFIYFNKNVIENGDNYDFRTKKSPIMIGMRDGTTFKYLPANKYWGYKL